MNGWLRRQWHLAALTGWTAVWFVILARHGGIAWKFFVQGTDLLFSGHDGASTQHAYLHIYATYPQLQIGPVPYLVAEALRHLAPDDGVVAAELLMSFLGLVVLALIQRIAVAVRPDLAAPAAPAAAGSWRDRLTGDRLRLVMLVGGAVFVMAWEELAVAYGHLDDAIALTCAVAAVWCWVAAQGSVRARAVAAGVLLGLAGASKPWAFVFLPVLLLPWHPGEAGGAATARTRWRAAGLPVRLLAVAGVVAVTLAAWLPFFAADPATTNAMHYQIANMPDSALRALGVHSAMTPSWDRSVQVVLGCVLGAVAIARRRWAAVILLGAGARIALDPGVHGYYTPEVMAGALLWDLLGPRRPVPLWSLAGFAALNLAPLITHDSAVLGGIRLGVIVAFTAAILLGPARWYWGPDPGVSSAEQVTPLASGAGR